MCIRDSSWDEGVVTTEPTCTEDGVRTYTCAACGATRTEAIPATGHVADEGKVTKEPTCTEDGVRTYTCTVSYTHLRKRKSSSTGR